jgi:nicotinamide riboside transporter PnuC
MIRFLKTVDWIGLYVASALGVLYFASAMFAMRSSAAQDFFDKWGSNMFGAAVLVWLTVGWIKHRLETTPVPGRDSVVFGWLCVSGIILDITAYNLPEPPQMSGWTFAVIFGLALFAGALSVSFDAKEKEEWRKEAGKKSSKLDVCEP